VLRPLLLRQLRLRADLSLAGRGRARIRVPSARRDGYWIASAAAPDLPDRPRDRPIGSFQLCIYTDDTDAAAERLVAQGVTQLTPPRVMGWGEKLAFFEDPDGNLIHITAVTEA
jgi:catechol 2,3-dioxygenase-like lactoylglutathione lyase family enzyme